MTNAAGAIAQTYTFDSFGNQTASSGSVTNPFRFTAREFDSETGLHYYRARYYDASVGRFLSEGPIGFQGALNRYPCAFGHPTDLINPYGLFSRRFHRDETLMIAQEVFAPGCTGLAQNVASADAMVNLPDSVGDAVKFAFGFGKGWQRPGPHFPEQAMLDRLETEAFTNCDLAGLGQYLHSLQDSLAHNGKFSKPWVHYLLSASTLGVLNPVDDMAENDATLHDAFDDVTRATLIAWKGRCRPCCK